MRKLFFILSIGLTLISFNAGYHIYSQMYNIETAILIICVFETLRLSSLYGGFNLNKYKFLIWSLYILVAITCFIISTISFNNFIIEKNELQTNKYYNSIKNDLFKIKQSYHNNIIKEIDKIEKDLKITEKKYTSWQSKVYKRRIELYNKQINDLLNKEEKYLNLLEKNKNNKIFIANEKAKYNIKTNGIINKESILSKSIEQTLYISKHTTERIFGYLLSFIIEFGIIILAIISVNIKEDKDNITNNYIEKTNIKLFSNIFNNKFTKKEKEQINKALQNKK